jgi:hypothetical protein
VAGPSDSTIISRPVSVLQSLNLQLHVKMCEQAELTERVRLGLNEVQDLMNHHSELLKLKVLIAKELHNSSEGTENTTKEVCSYTQ